jgi:cell division septation protein DedD
MLSAINARSFASHDTGPARHLIGLRLIVLTFGMSLSSMAWSAMNAAGVQYPAWKVVDDRRIALAPGATVSPGDKVVTGKSGKAWLEMDDGALVKLGEQADFRLESLSVSTPQEPASSTPATTGSSNEQKADRDQGSFMEGAMSVIKGAFRYTSDEESTEWNRDLAVSMGDVATISIRGTDLWGKVSVSDAFVVLLEGLINVESSASPPLTMDTPLQIFQSGQGELASVSMEKVKKLAPETELDFGSGVMAPDGPYLLHLASFKDRNSADALKEKMVEAGLASQIVEATVENQTWHRLTVPGLASYADAEALSERVGNSFGFDSAWVAPR